MNTIPLSSTKIDTLLNLDKCIEFLEDCRDIDPINSNLSRLIDLALYLREDIMHL
jgi:hypothetical protein